jgi:hypothetical protein
VAAIAVSGKAVVSFSATASVLGRSSSLSEAADMGEVSGYACLARLGLTMNDVLRCLKFAFSNRALGFA